MSQTPEPSPLPSRRVLRAAEREAEKKAARKESPVAEAPEAVSEVGDGAAETHVGAREGSPSAAPEAAQGSGQRSFLPGHSKSRNSPFGGSIPAVPAHQGRTVPAIPQPTVPLAEIPRAAFAAAPVTEPTLALPARVPAQTPAAEQPAPSRAGRNLPAAIAVGLPLLILVLGGLLFYPPAFLAMVILASALGIWELSRAFLQRGVAVPLVPMMVGVLAMPVAAYYAGAEGLLFALVACSLAILVWRTLDPVPGAGQSIFAGTFVLAWVPFLISFSVLILREPNHLASVLEIQSWPASEGALKVSTMLLLVVANDTFGYLVGALFGKHPMAPKISPKKSWEGFAGSVVGALIIGVLAAIFLLGQPFWVGMVLAVAIVAAGTAGDLAESMVKRELGVKDMSSILPGHGGLMDRLDSILFAAPMGFLIYALLGLF